jgi:hypothetical protein
LDHLVEAVVDGLVFIGHGRQPGRGEQPLRHAALRHQAHADLVDQLLRVDGRSQYQHKKIIGHGNTYEISRISEMSSQTQSNSFY